MHIVEGRLYSYPLSPWKIKRQFCFEPDKHLAPRTTWQGLVFPWDEK